MKQWNIQSYPINSLLNKENLINVIDKFWLECIQPLKSDETAILFVRLVKNNSHFITISVLQIKNSDNL